MSELPSPGALVGPTLACLIGEQFERLRKCDRFWYENDNVFESLSQLDAIRKVTMAVVVCKTCDSPNEIQRSDLWTYKNCKTLFHVLHM